jgi:hypothetical protein
MGYIFFFFNFLNVCIKPYPILTYPYFYSTLPYPTLPHTRAAFDFLDRN